MTPPPAERCPVCGYIVANTAPAPTACSCCGWRETAPKSAEPSSEPHPAPPDWCSCAKPNPAGTMCIICGGELPAKAPQSLASLKGVGKELWQGEDAQAYVNELRDKPANSTSYGTPKVMEKPAAAEVSWPKEALKNINSSLKLQSMLAAPDHAWLGPSVIELAQQAYDAVCADRDDIRAKFSKFVDTHFEKIAALKAERDELAREVQRLRSCQK